MIKWISRLKTKLSLCGERQVITRLMTFIRLNYMVCGTVGVNVRESEELPNIIYVCKLALTKTDEY